MLVIYYNTKDGNKGWIKAENIERIDKFIQEHSEVADYEVTCVECDYHELRVKVNSLTNLIKAIKGYVGGIEL